MLFGLLCIYKFKIFLFSKFFCCYKMIRDSLKFQQHVKAEEHVERHLSVETDEGDEENVSDVPLNLVATSLSEETHWE